MNDRRSAFVSPPRYLSTVNILPGSARSSGNSFDRQASERFRALCLSLSGISNLSAPSSHVHRRAIVLAASLSILDRDGIFAPAVDEALRSMSLEVLKTPDVPASERTP